MNKIIFSYCRVSTGEQATEGKSGLENQQFLNEKAIKKLMSIDNYVRGDDLIEIGSAFKGKNLSDILSKARAGEYPKGSVVVMFDQTRFSRDDFFEAISKMREIVSAGLSIHFSTTEQTVGKELLDDFGGFIALAAQAKAANDESANRRNRTIASYSNKVESGQLVNVGLLPNWIRKVYKDGNIVDIELIPERADVICKIFEFYQKGHGATFIVGWLNENIPVWKEHHNRVRAFKKSKKLNDTWTESYVTRLLKDKRLIGERIFYKGKSNEIIRTDYYPPAISKETFYNSQVIRKAKNYSPTIRKYPPIIYMGLAKCGYCGGRIAVQQYLDKKPVIRCSRHAKKEEQLCAGGTSPAYNLESVLIKLCSDKVNYNTIFQTEEVDIPTLEDKKRVLEDKLINLNSGLDKIEDLFISGDISKERYVKRKSIIDEDMGKAQLSLTDIKNEIIKYQHQSTEYEAEFLTILNNLKSNEISIEVRHKLKVLLPKFIDEILVYRYGLFAKPKVKKSEYEALIQKYGKKSFQVAKVTSASKDKNMLTYRIIFKSGGSRHVLFNNGDWKYVDSNGESISSGGAYDPSSILF